MDDVVMWLVAAVAMYKIGIPLVSGIYKRFVRPAKNLKKYGEWAVVTGATDGIGKALSVEFAKRGLNVLLISRTESKLVEVEAELKKFPGKFAHVACDFSGGFCGPQYDAVVKALSGLDVGVLVNNVGMSYSFAKYYHELTEKEARDLIALNVESTFLLTKLVLDGMVARKRGCILNISSAAGTQISPLLAGYSGAKGAVVMFSKSLHAELKPKGIDVQLQNPLFVTTKLAKIRNSSLTVPTPETYAKSAIRALGYDAAISPYWTHALQLWLVDCLPESLAVAIVSNMHHAIRKKGLKKQQANKDGATDKKAQ